ncbi:uncharacterized protein LOC130077763 [Rhinichthys klamathensis goyatoka]|uniref:uncharacterized protein LOC130077763 n=1 Tax=Rhinichthys klamathensis goyatoka TaxID=3034132 RepID=UPI0024B62F43|nr:uncharacterized protein LOC130077763 [Rhinichthys klamathensis goyatoka]
MKRYNPESFHRLPLHNSDMLKQWLVVLHVDVETPVETLREMDYRVCSKHFDRDDFILSRRASNPPRRNHLKKSAVPRAERPVADNLDEASGSEPCTHENTSELAALPQSTPKRFQHTVAAQSRRSGQPPAFRLSLSTPEHATVRPRTTPTSSGMYLALPPTWQLSEGAGSISHWSPIHAGSGAMSQEDMDEGSKASVHDMSVSFGEMEMEDPVDASFQPLSDTTPSSQESGSGNASDQGKTNGWAGKKWIVDESNLLELFKTCHTCGTLIEDKRMVTRASQLKIYWTCLRGHSGEWASCPDQRDMGRNNLLTCAATLFTGASYTDIKDWADLMNIQIPAKTQYYNIQSAYLIPVVNYAYKDQQQKIMERLTQLSASGERIDLCGDARCDSPGFSSKYSTYSFQDDVSKEIVHYELVQVTEASSSVAMEAMGFQRGLDHLISKGVDVGVMTTDRSPSIRKIINDNYTNIRHEFDSWHVNKSVKKKLVKVSNKAENRVLQPWIRSISNHLYWSCSSSHDDEEECVRRWTSLQYHVCGVHRWEEDGGLEYHCLHPSLTEEEQTRKKWLTKDSTAQRAKSRLEHV